jgi:hypothetical protein
VILLESHVYPGSLPRGSLWSGISRISSQCRSATHGDVHWLADFACQTVGVTSAVPARPGLRIRRPLRPGKPRAQGHPSANPAARASSRLLYLSLKARIKFRFHSPENSPSRTEFSRFSAVESCFRIMIFYFSALGFSEPFNDYCFLQFSAGPCSLSGYLV